MQPNVARNLLEQHASVEKGLCQRFLWCVPKPTMSSFDELEKIDSGFSASIGNMMYVTCHHLALENHLCSYQCLPPSTLWICDIPTTF